MPQRFISDLWRPRAGVGLYLEAGAVRAVRVTRTENGPRVDGLGAVEFPPDRPPHPSEIEAAGLRVTGGLIDEKTRLAVGLQAREAGLHLFNLPFDRPEKVRRVLRYEAEPLFLDPVEDMVLDYLPLEPVDENERPAAVFGAQPEAVAALLDRLAPAGLDPDQVLPVRLGLILAGEHLFQNQPPVQALLLLDLGTDQTGLTLFLEGRPVKSRAVFLGGLDLARTLARNLGLDLVEAEKIRRETDLGENGPSEAKVELIEAWQPLLIEIERSLAAWLPGLEDKAAVIVLSGEGARTPGLDRLLAQHLGVETMQAMDYGAHDPRLSPLSSEMTAPFGLALAALAPGRQPNLRQGQLAPQRTLSRHQFPLALMAAGLLLTLLLNLGSLLYTYWVQDRAFRRNKAEVERVFTEALPGVSKVVAPVAQLRQELEKSRGQARGFGPEGGRVLDLLLAVSRVAGAHAGLRITDLALSPKSLDLSGEGGSFDVIDRLKNELADLPYFSEASLGGARMDPTIRVLTFKISLKRKAK